MPSDVTVDALRNAIAELLAQQVKSYDLPEAVQALGLGAGDGSEAHQSKRLYVLRRLPSSRADLLSVAERVLERWSTYRLEELVWRANEERRVSELTRRGVLEVLAAMDIAGRLDFVEFLRRTFPLDQLPPSGEIDPSDDIWDTLGQRSLEDEIYRHMVRNEDWSLETLFSKLGLLQVSERRFLRFLEQVVDPVVRRPSDQQQYVTRLNEILRPDGVELRQADLISGYPVYRAVRVGGGVAGTVKNLIFAANGPKPEIVIKDALNNDIEITRNAQYCLVYDRPLPANGLLWKDLVEWWATLTSTLPDVAPRTLGARLHASLASEPERLLFAAYFESMKPLLGDRLPALVPQVYLHYDPLTVRQLGGVERLARQRMDFLLLLSSYSRVVVEVDGKQHYADAEKASPAKYARMVAADRDLRLSGYEVYRFGGHEMQGDAGRAVAAAFFTALMRKHGLLP